MSLPTMNVLNCKIGVVDFTLDHVLDEDADSGGTTEPPKDLVGTPPSLKSTKLKDAFKTMVKAFGKHLEEKHVTWARFGKKLDKNTTLQVRDFHSDAFTKSALKVKLLIKIVTSQSMETA
ncbi:hypothetical protein Tco_1047658 [Tanacetum coccineum]